MALAQDFETVEESLRNVLRHNSKYQPVKSGMNQRKNKTENAFTQSNDYITVYDRHQPDNLENEPNISDAHRPQAIDHTSMYAVSPPMANLEPFQEGQSNLDEFKRYCSLLTDRIRRVEEQNIELLRIAERQKLEYDKVILQVVESEHSQRQLINECSNLRKQVQELSYHNKILKDQQDSGICVNEELFLEGASHDFQDDQNKQSLLTKSDNYNHVVEVLKLLRINQLNDVNGNAKATNLASVMDLFAAIELASQNAKISQSPSRKKMTGHCADPSVSVIRQRSNFSFPTEALNYSNHSPTKPPEKSVNQINIDAAQDSSSAWGFHSTLSQKDDYRTSTPEIERLPVKFRRENPLRRSLSQTKAIASEKAEEQRPASLLVDLECTEKFREADQKKRSVSPKVVCDADNSRANRSLSAAELLMKNGDQIQENVSLNESCSSSSSSLDNALSDLCSKASEELCKILADDHSSPDLTVMSSTEFHQRNEKGSPRAHKEQDMLHRHDSQCERQETPHEQQALSDQDQNTEYQSTNFQQHEKSPNSLGESEKRHFSADLRHDNSCLATSDDSRKPTSPRDNETKPNRNSFFSDHTLTSLDARIADYDEDLLNSEAFLETGRDEFIFISSSPQTKPESPLQTGECKTGKIKSADEPQRRLLKKQATRPQKSFEESSKRYSLTPSPTTGADERKPEKLRLDEPVFGQKNDILRNRTFSEGSIERVKPLDKLTSRLNQHLEFRRQSSAGIGESAAHKSILANIAAKQKLDQDVVTPATKNLRRPRFPTTNPNSRLKFQYSEDLPAASESSTSNCSKASGASQTKEAEKGHEIAIASCKVDGIHKSHSVVLGAPKQSKLKFSKRTKSFPSVDSKKSASSGGAQSRSFVGLVKSKLSRSYSKSINAGRKNSFEYSKHSQGSSPVRSNISERNKGFSPLNNGYLPPGKDGDLIRKQTKQKLLDKKISSSSEILIVNDCEKKAQKVSEDFFSDEGFAEGSTIERSEKEDSSPGDMDPSHQLPDDIVSLRSKMFASANVKPSVSRSNINSALSEKNISTASDDAPWKNSRDLRSRSNSISAKQVKSSLNQYSSENLVVDSLLGNDIGLKVDHNNDVYVTGVTIVPSSALNSGNSGVSQTNKLRPKKIQKPPSGVRGLGRLMKSMSSHHGGSKEDLFRKKDFSIISSKETKKNKASEQQKNIEKAFMSSMVQAELSQGLNERCSVEASSVNASKEELNEKLSGSSANCSESIETRSSLSSIPSFGSTSSQSTDAEETSHFKRDLADISEKHVALQEKSGYNQVKSSGYSGCLNKSTSLDSNVSTSDSETNFEVGRLLNSKNSFMSRNAVVSINGKTSSSSQVDKQLLSNSPGNKISTSSKLSFSSASSKNVAQNTKLANSSKVIPGKYLASQKSGIKPPEKSTVMSGQTSKTKLAPLSYGFGANKTTSQVSNFSMLESSKRTTTSQSLTGNIATQSKLNKPKPQQSIKNPNLSTKPPTAFNSSRLGNNKITPPKTRTNIPPSGLQRPRPVYTGIGAM